MTKHNKELSKLDKIYILLNIIWIIVVAGVALYAVDELSNVLESSKVIYIKE